MHEFKVAAWNVWEACHLLILHPYYFRLFPSYSNFYATFFYLPFLNITECFRCYVVVMIVERVWEALVAQCKGSGGSRLEFLWIGKTHAAMNATDLPYRGLWRLRYKCRANYRFSTSFLIYLFIYHYFF